MALYHLLHDADWFQERLIPPVAAAWRTRSFVPCQELAAQVLPQARAFAERYQLAPQPFILASIESGLRFDHQQWRRLVSELLWFSAHEIPEIETCPDTLLCVLAPGRYQGVPGERREWSPIEQVHFGARDLHFGGGFYRPEHSGWNDRADVARLKAYLAGVRPETWTPANLRALPDVTSDEERAEELAYARDRLAALQALYERADAESLVVLGESL